jgi:ELWxxDGT repeat protein
VSVINTSPGAFFGSGNWAPVEWQGELWFQSSGKILRFDGNRIASLVTPPFANSEPVLFNDSLYYAAQEAATGVELWRFNGVSQTRVSNISPGAGDAFPEALFVHDGALYFRARDATTGNELWRYDGTAIERVADLNPGAADANPSGLATFQGALYFAADDGVHGTELWRFDGTEVSLAADVNPNPVYEEGGDRLSDSNPRLLTPFAGALYFAANGGEFGGLWRFDGADAALIGGGSLNEVTELIIFNDALYFDADDGISGRELWKIKPQAEPALALALPGNSVEIQLEQAETGDYAIEVTADLVNWTRLHTARPIDGHIIFNDTAAGNASRRLYRAVKIE